MEIVTMDKLGRILLPKSMRNQLHMKPGSRWLAVPAGRTLVLQELNSEKLLVQLRADTKDLDLDRIVRDVQRETERDVRARYADVLAGHQPVRGGNSPSSPPDGKPAAGRTRPR